MMDLRLSRGVEEVIIVKRDEHNRRTTRTIFRKSKKQKKGTGPMETLSTAIHKVVTGQKVAAETYLQKHDESNRTKKDGWIRDLGYNVYRATSRGLKKVGPIGGLPAIDCDN
jgi:hypothetical protein